MNFIRKHVTTVLLAATVAVSPLAAQDVSVADLQEAADGLAESFTSALPFNSTVGLNWSDAYIKQFPHFGAGVVLGATTMDAADVTNTLEKLGYNDVGDIGDKLPLPAAAFEGRLGGFVWPFDIGFKIGFIPESVGESISAAASGLTVDYLLVGFDVRYALLKGGGFMPKLSVGGGFNYLKGGVSATADGGKEFSFEDPSDNVLKTIRANDPEIGLEWETKVIDLKAQASWKFLIFTPYVGLGASYGMSSAGYFITSTIEYDDGSGFQQLSDSQVAALLADLREYRDALVAMGEPSFDIPDISSTGISSSLDVNGWSARTFGGLSITPFPFLRFDITGLYNFIDSSYGATFGFRIQF